MARTIHTARLNPPTPVSDPTTSAPSVSRLHTTFVEVRVHTAKCDSCDRHNKLTLYRCTECGQHVCSLCWRKAGDGTHVFGGGLHDVPGSDANHLIEDDDADSERGYKKAGKTHARRRVQVISDDEDDDVPMLEPARTMENAEVNDASKQDRKEITVIMNDDHHEDHEDDLPRLWPVVASGELPVLTPVVPAANTTASESVTRATQRDPHIYGEEGDSEHQRILRVYDSLGRQTMSSRYGFVGDQETSPQARHPSQSSISHHQATQLAPSHIKPAIYRPRPGADVDKQPARNQLAFANSQATNRQAPRPAPPLMAHQQATELAPDQIKPAVYRPRPGADVDKQAARNQLAFANSQPTNRQAPRPDKAPTSHEQAVHPAPRTAQASISPQHAHTAANVDRVAVRSQQILRLNQQAQAYANAKQMEARNGQALSSHQSTRPAADRDQVAAHNQQAFISNQLSSSGATYVEQMIAARDRQQAYLSRQQANHPTPGPPQTSFSYRGATNTPRFPAQAFLSQQHAALLTSRQAQHRIATQDHPNGPSGGVRVREHSPEILEAADTLLFYAGVDQTPGVRLRSEQDENGVSRLVSAAGQLEKASSARSKPRSSSKTFAGGSGAAETHSNSSRGPALNPTRRSTDAGSAKARLDKHRARLAGLHSPAGTQNTFSDRPVSIRGHPSYPYPALQSDPGRMLADSSAAQFHKSSFRGAQSHPGPRLPMSEHAATYLNQWNSGRAAMSSSSSSTAVDVPATRLNHPNSPVPALHLRSTISVQGITATGRSSKEAAEASTRPQALSAPTSVAGGLNDVDVVMGSPDVEIFEYDESRRSETRAPENNAWTVGMVRDAEKARARAAGPTSELHAEGKSEKHPRGEKKGHRETNKEHKASSDVDVIDARKRNSKDKHSEQTDDDDSDIEITYWNKLDSNKTAGNHQDTNAEAKGPKPAKIIKKGVSHIQKPEPKGQKEKTTVDREFFWS